MEYLSLARLNVSRFLDLLNSKMLITIKIQVIDRNLSNVALKKFRFSVKSLKAKFRLFWKRLVLGIKSFVIHMTLGKIASNKRMYAIFDLLKLTIYFKYEKLFLLILFDVDCISPKLDGIKVSNDLTYKITKILKDLFLQNFKDQNL